MVRRKPKPQGKRDYKSNRKMNTKQVIEQMEKEFDETKLEKLLINRVYGLICKDCAGGGADGQDTCQKCEGCGIHSWKSTELKDDLIKLYKSSIRTLLEAFAEELIGKDETTFILKKTPETELLIDEVPTSLDRNRFRDMQRNKAKEIINSLKK